MKGVKILTDTPSSRGKPSKNSGSYFSCKRGANSILNVQYVMCRQLNTFVHIVKYPKNGTLTQGSLIQK